MTKNYYDTLSDEQSLLQSIKRFDDEEDMAKRAIELSGIMFVILDAHGIVRLVNRKGCDILEGNREDIVGQNWFNTFLPSELQKEVSKVFKQLMKGEVIPVEYFENEIMTLKGNRRVIKWHNALIQDEKGRPVGVISSGDDITKQRGLERDLYLAKVSIDRSSVSTFWIGSNGRFINVNDAACVHLGYSRKEFESLTVSDIDPDFPSEIWPKHWEELKEKKFMHFQSRHKKKSGEIFPVEVEINYIRFGDQEYNFAYVRNISDRVRDHGLLVRHGNVLEAINEVLQSAITSDSHQEVAKRCLEVAEGYTQAAFGLIGEINKKGNFDTIALSDPGWAACRIPRGDAARMIENIEMKNPFLFRAIKKEKGFYMNNLEGSTNPPEGHPPITSYLSVPLWRREKVVGMISVANKEGGFVDADLSFLQSLSTVFIESLEHKRSEENVLESEERYYRLLNSARDAILVIDVDTRKIIDGNKKSEELFDCPLGTLTEMSHEDLHPDDERKRCEFLFQEKIRHGEEGHTIISEIVNGQGERIPVQISSSVVHLRGRRLLMSIFRDISEFKRIEMELRHEKDGLLRGMSKKTLELKRTMRELEDARRLSDIGILAATVAHELRNPLGVINTAIYNVKRKRQNKDIDRHLANIEKKINESNQIIENLLSYARLKMPTMEDVNVHALVHECVEHLSAKHREKKVELDLKCNCRKEDTIRGDRVQIMEVIENILDNAYQAIDDEGGKVFVEGEYNIGEGSFTLTVSDNGVGIPEKEMDLIFDPFFTTRARGIGLGLTVCRQIIQLHHGRIKIESQARKGTKVTIILPV